MNHYEAEFEQEFGRICPLWGMKYLKVPDFIHAADNKIVAHKRPCDGILCEKHGNYLLEFKFKYGKLKPHQRKIAEQVNAINNSYYIVRKSVLKKGTIYSVENELGDFMFTTEKLEELFVFFRNPTEQFSQQIMMDNLIPEKPKKRLNRTRY